MAEKNFADRAKIDGLTRDDMLTLVANSSLSPAGKRKAFKQLGVMVEYQPHQGERERARRLKQAKRQEVG